MTRRGMIEKRDEYGVYYAPTNVSRNLARALYDRAVHRYLVADLYATELTEQIPPLKEKISKRVGVHFRGRLRSRGRDFICVAQRSRQKLAELQQMSAAATDILFIYSNALSRIKEYFSAELHERNITNHDIVKACVAGKEMRGIIERRVKRAVKSKPAQKFVIISP